MKRLTMHCISARRMRFAESGWFPLVITSVYQRDVSFGCAVAGGGGGGEQGRKDVSGAG